MKDTFVILNVKLQPGAREDGIVGIMDDGVLKVRVKAKPVEGKANEGLIKLMAKEFAVPASKIDILSGAASKKKLIKIRGKSKEELEEIIKEKFPISRE
jgi:uncharacterized protein (TIGR00251 family)